MPQSFEKWQVYLDHRDGISREQLRRNCKIGTATVERWFHDHLELKERMFSGRECPAVLGIDEHFFSKKKGCVTTFFNLKKHRGSNSPSDAQKRLWSPS